MLDRLRHDHRREQRRCGDDEAAALAVRQFARVVNGMFEILDQPVHRLQEFTAGGGQFDASRRAVEKPGVELFLQLAHDLRQGRLGKPQPLGRCRERAGFRHCLEAIELAQSNIHQP